MLRWSWWVLPVMPTIAAVERLERWLSVSCGRSLFVTCAVYALGQPALVITRPVRMGSVGASC